MCPRHPVRVIQPPSSKTLHFLVVALEILDIAGTLLHHIAGKTALKRNKSTSASAIVKAWLCGLKREYRNSRVGRGGTSPSYTALRTPQPQHAALQVKLVLLALHPVQFGQARVGHGIALSARPVSNTAGFPLLFAHREREGGGGGNRRDGDVSQPSTSKFPEHSFITSAMVAMALKE